MDRWKYFDVVHRDHVLWNPLSEAKVDELIALFRLPEGGRVLDIACGIGEFAARTAHRWQAHVTGVDLSPGCVATARRRVESEGISHLVDIVEKDGAKFEAPAASFDVTVCLGASWIWGGYSPTLGALAHWTKPGGMILSGEPYWRSEPSPELLEVAGFTRELFNSHAGNVEAGTIQGLNFLHSIVSSEDDWDRYEGLHSYGAERWARENPDDPDVDEILERARAAYDAYLKWGRDQLGWATYLFMKP